MTRDGRTRNGDLMVLRLIAVIVSCLVLLAPLYWMVVVAFSPRSELLSGRLRLWPRTLTLDNFSKVLHSFPITAWFGNSLAIAACVTVLTVVVNLLAGYAFAQLRFRGSSAVLLLILSTLVLPVQVIIVSLFKLVSDLSLYGTYWAVILPTSGSAFGIFLSRQFMLSIPTPIIEAARIDGAGQLRVFIRIVLPLCKPLIAVLSIMTLLTTWNDLAWPLVALKQNNLFTLPIGLLFLQGQNGSDYGPIMALSLIAVAPMVALFLVFQRYFVQGLASSGIN